MYPNLDAEMAREKVTTKAVAEALGLDERSVRNKIAGKTKFFYIETVKIKDTFFPEADLEYLFKTDEADRKNRSDKKNT